MRYDKNGNALDSVTAAAAVVKCEAKDNLLETRMLYSSADDLTAFDADSLLQRSGSTVAAGVMTSAPDAVLNASLIDSAGEAFEMEKILEKNKGDQYRYIICDAASVLYGDGNVIAYSQNGVYTKSYGCVEVPEGETVIVIFSNNKK